MNAPDEQASPIVSRTLSEIASACQKAVRRPGKPHTSQFARRQGRAGACLQDRRDVLDSPHGSHHQGIVSLSTGIGPEPASGIIVDVGITQPQLKIGNDGGIIRCQFGGAGPGSGRESLDQEKEEKSCAERRKHDGGEGGKKKGHGTLARTP